MDVYEAEASVDELRERITELEQQIAALREERDRSEQKAFWAGFEASHTGLTGTNIQKAWEKYKAAPQEGE